MDNGTILVKMHHLYYPYVGNCQNLVMHVNLENAHNANNFSMLQSPWTSIEYCVVVALLQLFCNQVLNVASMFFFSNLLHCRCKDASPKGGYRRATPMLQIFHVCDDNPQRHRILLHSRNHHKDQLEQKMGKSWWHFVVS